MKSITKKAISIALTLMLIFNVFSIVPINTAFATEGVADKTISDSLDLNGGTMTIEGNVLLKADVNINKGTLIVTGDLYQASGEMYLNGGTLIVKGNYRIQALLKTSSGTNKFIQSTGTLVMDNPEDLVKVEGDFYTQSNKSYSENRYPFKNAFSEGVMELYGSFYQIASTASKSNFYTMNSHKVVFKGTKQQNVSFEASNSCFNQLELQNDNIVWSNHMAVNSFVSNANITPNGLLVDKVNVNGKTVTFNGDVTAEADIDINSGEIVVKGNLYQPSGEMYFNGGKLRVQKDYRIQAKQKNSTTGLYDFVKSTGTIVMDNDNDFLAVDGNFYTQSTSYYSENRYPKRNALSKGVMEIKGNFTQISTNANKHNFYAQGTHKVVLNGVTTQTINFEAPESCFNQLDLKNSNIIWSAHMSVNQLVSDAYISPDNLTVDLLNVNSNTITFNGDILVNGNIDVNYGTMNVKGNVYQSGGAMYLDAGTLHIEKDYRIQTYQKNPTTGEEAFVASNGNLVMDDPSDLVLIDGSFYTQSTQSYSESKYANSNALSNGVMEVKGGFFQVSENADANNFYCKSSHKVILNGTATQYVYFESATSAFNMLELQNENIVWSGHMSVNAFDSDAIIRPNKLFVDKVNVNEKTITFLSSITVENDVNINKGTITVKGDLYQTAGEMYLNGGTLHVEGNYRIQAYQTNPNTFMIEYLDSTGNIVMDNDDDLVKVDGSFYTQSTRTYSESRYYQRNALSKGVMEVKGDLYQISTNTSKSNFYAMISHRVILNGTKQQKVSFDSSDSHFNQIELVNKNVVWTGHMSVNSFESDASITPDNLLIDKINLNGKTVTILGDVTVENDVDINSGTLEVKGDLYQIAGEMYLNNGTLKVDRDYRVQSYQINSDTGEKEFDKSTGSVVMANASDYIKVGRDFYTQSTRYYHDIHYYQRNTYANGIMEIGGNFYQISTDANAYNFYAKDSHRVILNGTEKQSASFESTNSKFNELQITKPKSEYTFSRVPCWNKLIGIECNHVYDAGTLTTKPTCSQTGVMLYTCTLCGDTQTQIVSANSHKIVIDKAVKPTCTETGLTEGSHCSLCNKVLEAQKVIYSKGHTEVIDKAVAPTCEQTGLTEGKHCSVCNKVIVAQKIVDKLGHTEVIDKGYAPTETQPGLTDGSHCSVCNKVIKEQEIIPATGGTNPDKPIGLMIGDTNGDGKINILDATQIQKHLAKLVTLTPEQEAVADTNHDGKINILDATQIQKYLAKLIDKL